MPDERKSSDILGVQPLADSIKIVTKGAVDGATAFLSRICLPAAEEFGLLLKDRVSQWRARNLVSISEKTENILEKHGGVKELQVHPRIMNEIVETGSWSAEDDVQSMWAGLLASSCTSDGKDESSLVFINLLGQITVAQARLLNYACETAKKKLSLDDLLYAEEISLTPDDLCEIWRDTDIHRIDRELDHLHALQLTSAGFPFHDERFVEHLRQMEKLRLQSEQSQKQLEEIKRRLKTRAQNEQIDFESKSVQDEPQIVVEVPPLRAEFRPTPLALHLYVRCQGCRTSPAEFFGLQTMATK